MLELLKSSKIYKIFIIISILILFYFIIQNPFIKYILLIIVSTIPAIIGARILLDMGLVNFGYAMYITAGAYSYALVYKYTQLSDAMLALLISIASSATLGALSGAISAKLRGVFYALINLALSMIIYGILIKFYNITGGSDGVAISKVTLFGRIISDFDVFILSIVILFIMILLKELIYLSNYNFLIIGFKENEVRLQSLGVNTRKFLIISSTISAIFGGITGYLLAIVVGHVTPDIGGLEASALYVVLGIASYTIGVYLASVLYEVLWYISTIIGNLPLIVGLGLIIIYIYMKYKYKEI